MARTFNFTGSDRVAFALYTSVTNMAALTITAWTRRTGLGGSSLGRIITIGDNAGLEFTLYNQSVSSQTRLKFAAHRWATDGDWQAFPGWTDSSYKHVAVTYDAGSLSNDPVMYDNAVSQSVTEIATPLGADGGAGSGSIHVGNTSAANRVFQGQLWDIAVWNRVLSGAEIQTVMLMGPHRAGSGLVFYAPIWGQDSPEPNYGGVGATTGTVTNTTAAQNVHAGWSPWGFDQSALVGGFTAPTATARSSVMGMIG
jgi:hypothetical protein